MSFLGKSALPIFLAGIFMWGIGCGEQEQKAKDRGDKINQAIKNTQQKAKDAAAKIKDRISELENDLEKE